MSDIILGIDPGTQITGYGVLSSSMQVIDFGCIRCTTKLSLGDRYKILFESMETLIALHQPMAIAVESQFVLKNPQSAMKLTVVKGIVMLAASRANVSLFEYAPKKAKLAVVGNGKASKLQVQTMIQNLLHLPSPPEPEDAADALALAICCAHDLAHTQPHF